MSLDLVLLPFSSDCLASPDEDSNLDGPFVYSSEIIRTGGYFILDVVTELPSEPVPDGFMTSHGLSVGHCEKPKKDGYGKPLRCVRAGALAEAMAAVIDGGYTFRSHAALAYIRALPPTARIALYWT